MEIVMIYIWRSSMDFTIQGEMLSTNGCGDTARLPKVIKGRGEFHDLILFLKYKNASSSFRGRVYKCG
jgi:hypothetical protein